MRFPFIPSLAFACLLLNPSCVAKSTYSIVDGYFLQNDASTDAKTFDFMKHNFGLKPQPKKLPSQADWQYLTSQLSDLNAASPPGTSYKLIFLARHARAVHQSAREWYGHEWKKMRWQNGNATTTWLDAHLEDTGISQAKEVSSYWSSHLSSSSGLPLPEKYYSSPLFRCLQTLNFTFPDLSSPNDFTPSITPIINENLREIVGVGTYLKRSSRTLITAAFPTWEIEAGFTEKDELWIEKRKRKTHEQWDDIEWRVKEFLDELFLEEKEKTVISVTTHLGTSLAILKVIGHRKFMLESAQVIPVIVKGVIEKDGRKWPDGEARCGELGCRDVYWT